MFTNNKFKQLDAVAEMIKGIADADAKVKMQEMRGIIAGHNKMEVPVAEKLDENAFDWKNKPSELPTKPGEKAGFDSKKVSTGTVYQKKWKKEPTPKDEAVDPSVTTTDTLAGRVSGGAPNQHSSFKVKLKSEEMEKEELVGKQHKLDKNKNGKLDSQDFKMLRKEAFNDNMHPAAATLLKHIKPEHHNLYKPHLTTDVFNGSYKDRSDVLNAAKQAGHMKEEVELDEAKSNYELYHPQYSGAIHHALAHHASKAGLSVHDDDYHHHVSIGPRKPAEGASVSHSLPATDEKGGKHMIHMQIYNRGGDKKPYELNTYSSKIAKTSGRTMKEDTELDERTLSPAEKDAVEVNVKSMKKNLAGFKARYGKDAKSVMYATATKQAKKD